MGEEKVVSKEQNLPYFILTTKEKTYYLDPWNYRTPESFIHRLHGLKIKTERIRKYGKDEIKIIGANIFESHEIFSVYFSGWGIDDQSGAEETTIDTSVFELVNAALALAQKPDNLALVLDRLKALAFEVDAFDLGSTKEEIIAEYNAAYPKEESHED